MKWRQAKKLYPLAVSFDRWRSAPRRFKEAVRIVDRRWIRWVRENDVQLHIPCSLSDLAVPFLR